MSLWTPSGEHPVDRQPAAGGAPPPPGSPPPGASPPPPGVPPGDPSAPLGDQPPSAAEVEEVRRQLAATPAEAVVANHCYGLFELAAVYLSQAPPLLDQARLAIDALGTLVEGLGDRLGEPAGTLKDALAQLRLAYVELARAGEAGAAPTGADGHG
jgi:hypothetical protein